MSSPTKVVLANPRGFCAGVERALDIADAALAERNGPVFLRHAIVHNEHVVRGIEDRQGIFVEDIEDVPAGEVVIFSAHGTAPDVLLRSAELGHQVVDATCPLVHKVHAAARRLARRDDVDIVIVGHPDHQEVLGTLGVAGPGARVVGTVQDCERLQARPGARIGLLFQTTLSSDDMAPVLHSLRERFPDLIMPRSEQICYATQNRQDAVKVLAERCSLVLVVGSTTSSNCLRLVEVARLAGGEARLVGSAADLDPAWLDEPVVGITSGASTPEVLVQEVASWFTGRGAVLEEFDMGAENVQFHTPPVRVTPSLRQLADIVPGPHVEAAADPDVQRGLDIVLLGIDGVGKSTVADAIAAELRERGQDVLVTSWQRLVTPRPAGFEERAMSDLWVDLVRALYSGARTAGGERVSTLLPEDQAGFFTKENNDRFAVLDIASNSGISIMAAAAMELAGALLFRQLVVEPALRQGRIVVQESHPLKSIVKETALAELAGLPRAPELARGFLDHAGHTLEAWCRPSVGVLLHGDPGLTQRWRREQRGQLGPVEHLGLAGEPDESTFVPFQTHIAKEFARLTRQWGWLEVRMRDRPLAVNVRAAVNAVLEAPAVQAHLRTHGDAA